MLTMLGFQASEAVYLHPQDKEVINSVSICTGESLKLKSNCRPANLVPSPFPHLATVKTSAESSATCLFLFKNKKIQEDSLRPSTSNQPYIIIAVCPTRTVAMQLAFTFHILLHSYS